MSEIELIVTVSSPRELDGTDLRPYDAVCLGNPYCRRFEGNFAERLALLPEAVSALRAAGKKGYVTTPAAPRGGDLPQVERIIEAAGEAGAQALEVHNMGVLRILREKGNPLPAHMGAFANVYTHMGARVMREYGAVRVRPNAEVSLGEMETIAKEGGVEVEVLVHGKIPLGVTDRCSLLTEAEGLDPKCPAACLEERWLTTRLPARRSGPPPGRAGCEGAWVLKTVGKGVLSGRDMCMLEHLPLLLSAGFTVFKVEGLYETAAYRSEIGRVYREALALAASGGAYEVRPEWAEAVRKHSHVGLCNGYYFGKTGRLYVGTVLQYKKTDV
ncbi:MAG: U32 family peptidase [Deltaproteobacteria bacterium]|nr:U32 family peptidase [Deltaproteobacteria bacterium]